MGQTILEEVQAIEQLAAELKENYHEQIETVKREAEQKISEAKRNVDISLENYEEEQRLKNAEKKRVFQEELARNQQEEIDALKANFFKKKQDLIQETVKEVLNTYGNR